MKRDFIFVIALIFLQGYTTVPEFWDAASSTVMNPTPAVISTTATPEPIYTATPYISLPDPALLAPTSVPVVTAPPTLEPISAGIDRVLIISFDGMRPDAIKAAGMTNLLTLIESSAYTLSARTISYPTTLPSHTSMLSGMCMDKHGMRWNGDNLYRGYAQGTDIFDLTHAADMKSIMLVGKDKLRLIAQPNTTDDFEVFSRHTTHEVEVAQMHDRQPIPFGRNSGEAIRFRADIDRELLIGCQNSKPM